MKTFQISVLSALVASLASTQVSAADTLAETISEGSTKFNLNLRYEDVSTDAVDSDGLTLRSRLTYTSGDYNGFSGVVEFEDVRDVLGIDDENNLIADPETTELDQAFLQYKASGVTTSLGRQVIALDTQRFVGHVGWRQDRQTFDALRVQFSPVKGLNADLSYLYNRNRIFAETADVKSSDILANLSYMTPIGKLVGYGYFLDEDNGPESDTLGLSLTGSSGEDVKILYAVEFATQDITVGSADYSADYLFGEVGVVVSGITAKLGFEVLGSDDGAASFTTPLATLAKFNGWADIFLGGTYNPTAMPLGLEDSYLSLGTSISGIGLTLDYHDFQSDEGGVDYGSELDFTATKSLNKNYTLGLKYAAYSDDGYNAAGDVDKLWLWVTASF